MPDNEAAPRGISAVLTESDEVCNLTLSQHGRNHSLMTYTTDNRWSPGSSGATVPDDATAAYAARWIDMGEQDADIVPDRQGLAYDPVTNGRERLIDALVAFNGHHVDKLPRRRDETTTAEDGPLHIAMRRAGGYIYVDAWLVAS
jgi:hypothetical protein